MLNNLPRIAFSVFAIILGYIFVKVVNGRIENRMKTQRLGEHLALLLSRIITWSTIIVVFSVILVQFGVTLAVVSGFLTLVGGTILGFAAINTIGNAIAGFIIMTSRPFRVGDRIYFKDRFSDVISIDLIYTRLRTLDMVYVSVPNQELLKTEIDNYGKLNIIRRSVVVTAGYENASNFVEKALLEAAGKVEKVLKAPVPYVTITDFQNNAVEYTLFYFLKEVKRMIWIDAKIREEVFDTCTSYGIDLSTPLLTKRAE